MSLNHQSSNMNHIIWKSITIGKKITESQLKKAGIKVSDYVQDLLKWKEKGKIDLVKISVRTLFGDENPHSTTEIYTKAKEQGLELCPAEVGPVLRLEYKDQPVGEWLFVGMEPITDQDGSPHVWRVFRYDDGPWLDCYSADPADRWNPDDTFLFRLRKLDTSGTLTIPEEEVEIVEIRYKGNLYRKV